MQGYQCNSPRCLKIHDEVIRRLYKDDDGDSEILICPACGSEDLADVELCAVCCQDRVHESYGLCLTCAQRLTSNERLSDALREIALMPVNKEIAK